MVRAKKPQIEGKKFTVISIEIGFFSYVPSFIWGPPLKDPRATSCITNWDLLLLWSRWQRKVKIILEKLKRTHSLGIRTLALYWGRGEYGHTLPSTALPKLQAFLASKALLRSQARNTAVLLLVTPPNPHQPTDFCKLSLPWQHSGYVNPAGPQTVNDEINSKLLLHSYPTGGPTAFPVSVPSIPLCKVSKCQP